MSRAVTIFTLASFVAACSARVGKLPSAGETLRADAFALEAGGKGFNVAVGMRRLGATIDGLIPIGNDFLGKFAQEAIAEAGLPIAMVRRYDGPTGSGIGFIDSQGENCVAVFPGANASLCAATVAAVRSDIERADAVVAQFEIDDKPIEQAFAIARNAGITTVLNPSPYRPLTTAIRTNCDILVVNSIEAENLAQDEQIASAMDADHPRCQRWTMLAQHMFTYGISGMIVTDGARGATLFRPDTPKLHQPAFAVRTVSTLGAGDAFLAGLIASYAGGIAWPEAMECAAACGAIVAREHGVLAALPTRGQLLAHFANAA
jgi:ribokinase